MEKFSAFAAAEDRRLDGEKEDISDVFGKEIEVLAYRIMPSKAVRGKSCLQLQYRYTGDKEPHIIFSNSEVMTRQIEQYKEHIPFSTVIRKRGSYYTFS